MNRTLKNSIILITSIIGIVLVFYLKTIVVYLIISLVLALIGRPIMKLLSKIQIKKRNLPNAIKSVITLLVLLTLFTSFFALFTPLLMEEARIISNINFDAVSLELEEPINDLESWLKDKHLLDEKSSIDNEIGQLFSLTDVKSIFNSAIGILGNSIIALFSIIFITFFFLKEKKLYSDFLLALTPESKTNQILNVLKNIKRLLSRYFIGIILQISIITIIVSTGLSILGIKNAILIGFLAGIINVIPYIGPMIGAIIGVIIGISTNLDLDFYTQVIPLSLKICVVFAIMQLIDNFVLQPLIFSNSVKAHPLEIFIIVISAGTLWGILGMIIAIPFYTLFRVIAKEFLSEFKLVQELTKNI